MAVQAQQYYPSTTPMPTFSPDLHGLINPKGAPSLNVGGGGGDHVRPLRPLGTHVPSAAPKLQPAGPFDSATAPSGDPGSELTCNNGGPGKRKRAHPLYQMGFQILPQHNIQQPQPPPPLLHAGGDLALGNIPGTSWGSLLPSGTSYAAPYTNNSRSCNSGMASTTGRPPAEAQILPGHVAAVPSSLASSLLAQQLVSQLHQYQSVDIDDLISLQNKRLRSEVEQMRERHCRALLTAMQHGVLRRLRQKMTELESAKRRNAELEEKVRQMVAENEMWLNVARNNEAIASSLRAGLEQVLLKDACPVGAVTPAVDLEEGYGDSGSVAPTTPRVPEEKQYSCFHHGDPPAAAAAGEEEGRKGKQGKCRVCLEGEVSVLVLPCRHLCLCDKCEPRAAACPVCKAAINATLHVFFG